MELTGKCKEEFEKWFKEEHVKWMSSTHYFYNALSSSMQYGVYVDFFDSVGIDIEIWIECSYKPKYTLDFYAVLINDEPRTGSFSTRHEARTAAIEKANELFNKQ